MIIPVVKGLTIAASRALLKKHKTGQKAIDEGSAAVKAFLERHAAKQIRRKERRIERQTPEAIKARAERQTPEAIKARKARMKARAENTEPLYKKQPDFDMEAALEKFGVNAAKKNLLEGVKKIKGMKQGGLTGGADMSVIDKEEETHTKYNEKSSKNYGKKKKVVKKKAGGLVSGVDGIATRGKTKLKRVKG